MLVARSEDLPSRSEKAKRRLLVSRMQVSRLTTSLWSFETDKTGLMSLLGRDLFRSSVVLVKSSSAEVMVGELSLFEDLSCFMMEGREVVRN